MTTIQTGTFTLTAGDVIRASLDFTRHQRLRHQRILAAAFGAAALIIACPILIVQVFMPQYADWVWGDFLVTLREQGRVLLTLGALIGGLMLAQPLFWRYGVWRAVRENPDQYRDVQVTFSDQGIDFTWPHAALHNEWSFYQDYRESQEFFLLVYGRLYVAVPKRAVPDVPALARFLNLQIRGQESVSAAQVP